MPRASFTVSSGAIRRGILLLALAALCFAWTHYCPAQTIPVLTDVPASQLFPVVTLELRRSDAQQADLDAYRLAVQTPGAPEYHRWLTPAQFQARFAPSAEQATAVSQWLTAQGFGNVQPAPNGMRLTFAGSAQQVSRGFQVQLRQSAAGVSAAGTPVAPASLAAIVGDLSGFTDAGDAATLNAAIQTNGAAAVVLAGDAQASLSELLAEAAVQGITVLRTSTMSGDASQLYLATASTGFPSAVSPQAVAVPVEARPSWQSAPGLPATAVRAAPDASISDATALANALQGAVQRSGRVGELAPSLYRLAVGHGIFTHADTSVPEGTWSAPDGLGTLNVTALLKALATGSTGVNVQLSASNTTITHGQQLSLTFTVTGTGGTPGGTVTATLKGRTSGSTVTLGPGTLSANGTVTLSTNTLPGDTYDLSGSYSGDSTFASGTSNTVTTTVNPEPAVITATVPTTAPVVGGTIPVTVAVSSASSIGSPTGTVTVTAYYSGTPTTASATLTPAGPASGSATVNLPAPSQGSFTLQVTCTSSASFSCNQPQTVMATVGKATPTVTFTATPEAMVANSATQKYDLAVNVAAPVGSATGTAAPSGSVSIQDNGSMVATITLASGAGTYTLSLGGTGHSLTAVYSGDGNYVTATSAAVAINGALIATTTTLTTANPTATFGSAIPLTATVTPATTAAAGAPTGTITFKSSLQGTVATVALGTGFVTYNATTLQVGTHSITATYSGDTNYAASTTVTPLTVTVTPGKLATTTVLTVVPAQPLAGQLTTLTATVAPTAVPVAGTVFTPTVCTGQVTFFSNNIFVANALLVNGTASVQAALPGSGSLSLTAVYNGDTSCYGSTSAPLGVSPARIASVVSLTSSATYTNAGQTIQLTATVAPSTAGLIGVPTGTVNFFDNRNGIVVALGSATLGANGSVAIATLNVNGLAAGPHTFTAMYAGDGIFLPSTSQVLTVNFGDFSLAFSPASASVVRGGATTAQVTVSFVGGFAGPAVLSCVPPGGSYVTCSFSPASVSGGGVSTLTVQTSLTSAANHVPLPPGSRTRPWTVNGAAMGAVAAAMLVCLPKRRRTRMGSLLIALCCVVLTFSGCSLGMVDSQAASSGSGTVAGTGGTTAVTGTPYGTLLLTVTGSSADGTLRHSYSYAVNVQ